MSAVSLPESREQRYMKAINNKIKTFPIREWTAYQIVWKIPLSCLLLCWTDWDLYLPAQSQGHHSIDRLEERGVESGSSGQSSLITKTRKGHRLSDKHWNGFKRHVWNEFERRDGTHNSYFGLFRAHRYHLELKWIAGAHCHKMWPDVI